MDVVTLSRLQFGLTAMYHFLFVPLTLGLSVLLAIMESIYVTTGRTIWRDMVKFWGMLFGINFAMGVATGITMEFQFGTNWAYYAHYVGDIFGAPLAIEGLMAFFLEASFVGLFFFGWGRLSRVQHLIVTCLVALGTNLSALWILIANGWMQYPVGARFNLATMRMEVTDFSAVLFNPVAQAKFVHTVSAGYVVGAMFVMSISAYLPVARPQQGPGDPFDDRGGQLRPGVRAVGRRAGRRKRLHRRPEPEDENRRDRGDVAHRTRTGVLHHRRPAGYEGRTKPRYAIRVPWVLGLIATRSLDGTVAGIDDLVAKSAQRIQSGMIAYKAMLGLRTSPDDPALRATFDAHVGDLGYALLLKRYTHAVTDATPAQIQAAAVGHGAAGARTVLDLPHHGGAGFLLHRPVRGDVLAGLETPA